MPDDPEARRRALRALATGGSQAKAAQDDFERQIRADKARATQAALADAVRIDAPEAGAELQPRIEAPFDRYATATGAANQSRLATLRQMEAANRSYMSQVAAARPVVEGLARAKAAERAAKASKQDELSDSELRTRLMGAASAMQENLTARKAALQSGPDATAGTARMTDMLNADPANAPHAELARRIGAGAGLDPNRVHGLVPNPAPPKPASQTPEQQEAAQLRATTYLSEQKAAQARKSVYDTAKRSAGSKTFAEFENALKSEAGPVAYIETLSDDYLKKNRISRAKLLDWVNRYSAI